MDENDIAVKNKKAYIVDVVKIISGAILSLLLILIVLIFRNTKSFINGYYSLLDFTLLFLILTGGLFINGIKFLRNHKKMPEIMLIDFKNEFLILGDEVPYNKIKSLSGKHEFGRTGTVNITTDSATYKLYGVKNYADAIRIIESIIIKNK